MSKKDHEVTGGDENEGQSESFLFFIIINNSVVARSGIGEIFEYLFDNYSIATIKCPVSLMLF